MNDTPQPNTNDERLIAAIGHFLGMLASLIIWAVYQDRSPYLRIQSLRATSFGIMMVLLVSMSGMLAWLLYMIFIFVIIATPDGFMNNPALFFVLPIMALGLGAVNFIGLIIRLFAAVRTLQGHDFQYPIIGKWFARNFETDQLTKVPPT